MSTTLPLESEVCVPFRRYAQRAGVSPTSATPEEARASTFGSDPGASGEEPAPAGSRSDHHTYPYRSWRGRRRGLMTAALVVAFAPSGLRHACPAKGLPRAHRLSLSPRGTTRTAFVAVVSWRSTGDPERRPPRVEGRAGSNPSCTRQPAPAEDPAPMKAPVLACGSRHARWGSSGSSC